MVRNLAAALALGAYFAVVSVVSVVSVGALPVLRVATDATWPPMQFVDSSRRIVGFDIDLFTEIGRRAGFTPQFTNVAWDGIFAGLLTGQFDVIASSVTVLPERRLRMHFSDPYFIAEQYLVVRRDRTGVRAIEDLVGQEVGAEIGTTGAVFVANAPGVRLRSYDDLGLGLADLVNGRIAAVVADTAIVEHYVFTHPVFADQLITVGEPYAVEEYAFAIRRERIDLVEPINAALRAVMSDGTFEQIYSRWFRVTAAERVRPDHAGTGAGKRQ